MPTYFVGPGGNDANSGLTWALRKLTLNGAEDVPVVAGDIVIVGPGVYRELLTIDVAGTAVNRIVYIGDVTGENTDGVGGIVYMSGSDNDQTQVRANCISASNGDDFRTFRGFTFRHTSSHLILLIDMTDWIIEDCVFLDSGGADIRPFGDSIARIEIRRCLFLASGGNLVPFTLTAAVGVQDVDILIQNCVFICSFKGSIEIAGMGGVTARDCTFYGGSNTFRCSAAPPVGFTANHVENNLFCYGEKAISATALGEVTEDHNTFYENFTDRTNVAVGANSETYPPLFLPPVLHSGDGQDSGFKFPWWFSELSEFSQVRAITGLNEPAIDFRGIIRPATAAKNSWGATQFFEMERATGTVRTGVSSMVLLDAGINQMFIPITAEEITVEVYVQREAAYAGVNPQMIIKQPGQADRVTLDAGAAGAWNLLTDTFTPAALPPYVIVEFVSNNTAVAGAFSTFFDDLEVS